MSDCTCSPASLAPLFGYRGPCPVHGPPGTLERLKAVESERDEALRRVEQLEEALTTIASAQRPSGLVVPFRHGHWSATIARAALSRVLHRR